MWLPPLPEGQVHDHIVHSPGDLGGPEHVPSSACMCLCDFGPVMPPQFTRMSCERVNVLLDLEPFLL